MFQLINKPGIKKTLSQTYKREVNTKGKKREVKENENRDMSINGNEKQNERAP